MTVKINDQDMIIRQILNEGLLKVRRIAYLLTAIYAY